MTLPNQHFLDTFRKTHGALSVCEAIAIMQVANLAPPGIFMCLGAHKGKDAMAACQTLKDGIFYLVDPEFENKEWADNTFTDVCSVIDQKKDLTIMLIADISLNVIYKHELYSYVFVDSGSHGDGLPMAEARMLEDRMVSGGIIAWHDFRSQFTEVELAYSYLLRTGKFEEVIIDWGEIVRTVQGNDWEKGNTSWHHTELEFPQFVGALKRK